MRTKPPSKDGTGPLIQNEAMRKSLLSTLIKRPALAAIVLALAAGATGCAADTKLQADRFKPAKIETTYYDDPARTSDNDIETYDRWRYLFGS